MVIGAEDGRGRAHGEKGGVWGIPYLDGMTIDWYRTGRACQVVATGSNDHISCEVGHRGRVPAKSSVVTSRPMNERVR